MFNGIWGRMAAARTPPVRGFFLEAEPVPAPVKDRWEPGRDRPAERTVPLAQRIADALPGPAASVEELRRDREALEAANGRLVARVRVLEGQLRAAGIEPAARE